MFASKLLNIAELNSLHPKRSIFRFVESRWSIKLILCIFRCICYVLLAYSGIGWKPLPILAKTFILHVYCIFQVNSLWVIQKFTWKDYFSLTKLIGYTQNTYILIYIFCCKRYLTRSKCLFLSTIFFYVFSSLGSLKKVHQILKYKNVKYSYSIYEMSIRNVEVIY